MRLKIARTKNANEVRYQPPSKGEYEQEVKKIRDYWDGFVKRHISGSFVQDKDYFVHERNLFEVITRKNKKVDYYRYYHNIPNSSEYRQVGILCYWLIKLKPFFVANKALPIYNAPNERFALYIIICTINGIFTLKKKGEEFEYPTKEFEKNAIYDFKYCMWDEESMIRYVELLAQSYGIGPEIAFENLIPNEK